MTSHKHGLTAKYNYKMVALKVEFCASFKTNFSRVAGTLEGETSVSGETQNFIVTGANNKVSPLE